MHLMNSDSRYGIVSRALHWIIVLAIVGQWLLAEAEDDASIGLHQSLGFVALALALVRLGWRFSNPAPAWPPDMKPYEIRLASLVHVAFYVLLFAIPVSGWALASAEGEPLRFFDWFDLPRLVIGDEDTLEELHEILFNVLVALAALHVLGATKHWLTTRGRRRIPEAR
jgi:cytochrome b561